MRFFLKCDPRLIEADVAIVSKTKQLHIYAANRVDDLIVCFTCLFTVRLCAIRQEGTAAVDIDLAEQVLIHEIVVALIIVSGQPLVLIQVHGRHLREIQISLIIPLDQLLVCTDRSRSGRQSKHTVWLHNHLCRNDICCFSAQIVVIFCFYDFHIQSSFP